MPAWRLFSCAVMLFGMMQMVRGEQRRGAPEAAGALGWLGEVAYAAPGLRAEVQVGDLA